MGFTADISVGDCRLFWGDEPERQSSISSCFCSVTSYYLKDYPCTPVFIFIFCFLGLHFWYMEVPRLPHPAYPTATAMKDPSYFRDLTTAHSNARFFTCQMRTAVEPETSWLLVGLLSTALQQELLFFLFVCFFSPPFF